MNQKKWLRAAGHHGSVLNKRQYRAALSRSMPGAKLLLITSAVKGEGGKEGAHCSIFLCTIYFPQQPSHALCLFGSSSLLALARINLLSPAHTPAAQKCPAALCSSTGHQGRNSSQGALGKALSNLPCSQCWSCSELETRPENSQHLIQLK